jgi:hypothetical protein
MNVNGGRANMNYNRFNGTYFNNPSRNTGMNVPPPDAVQEFKVQTSNFAADSGRNPGANITVVSLAGNQRNSRGRVGIPPQRQPERAQFLPDRQTAVDPEPVRRGRRRADRAQ